MSLAGLLNDGSFAVRALPVADATQPYQVRTGCGHIVTRRMRPSTAGVAFGPAVVLEAPNGAPCSNCESNARNQMLAARMP